MLEIFPLSRKAQIRLFLADVVLAIVFGTGAAGALAFGKFLLGGVLAAFAFGVYARMLRRRRARPAKPATPN